MKNILICILSLILGFPLIAQNKGLEIAQQAHDLDEGFNAYEVELTMILKNANGQESTRAMNSQTLEVANDGDKSMISFMEPKDIKGTAMLTYSHRTESDDKWLFLPSIKRVKRISSNNKSGPFMGSEFAYEDLGSQEVEKYTYEFIKEEQNGTDNIALVDRFPNDTKSGYSKNRVYYNLNQNYRIDKIEFFDRKGSLLKTLNYLDYQLYKDKHWRANVLEVINHQSKKETKLIFKDYNFDVDLSESDFTQNSLKRAGR